MNPPPPKTHRTSTFAEKPVSRQNEYLTAIAGIATLTLACWLLKHVLNYNAIALIYLLGVLLAGMVLKRGPVLLVAAISALSWNFIFIPPLFTFHIAKVEDQLMFLTYFIVAITVGGLTAQLRAREHLVSQVRVAEESERLRKSLLDCVSHELKTPVAAINAASEALLRSGVTKTDSATTLAAEIHDGARRLTGVIDSLLDMTRLESGVIEPKCEWCDVRELLQAAVERKADAIGNRELKFDASENLPPVYLDQTLMEQAIAKLIANAASYAPANAPIEVQARRHHHSLVITVSDHGPGMSDPARVFEKFYRGDATKTGGLGLGLSIARGFVEAHGGEITAANQADGGAIFTIVLPAPLPDHAAATSLS